MAGVAEEGLFVRAEAQQCRPATRSGIALTGPIGADTHCWQSLRIGRGGIDHGKGHDGMSPKQDGSRFRKQCRGNCRNNPVWITLFSVGILAGGTNGGKSGFADLLLALSGCAIGVVKKVVQCFKKTAGPG